MYVLVVYSGTKYISAAELFEALRSEKMHAETM